MTTSITTEMRELAFELRDAAIGGWTGATVRQLVQHVLDTTEAAPASRDEATDDVLRASRAVAAVIQRHNLTAKSLQIKPSRPGTERYSPGVSQALPVLATVDVHLFNAPDALLDWCTALHITRITVHWRELDTCLHAWADVDDITWQLASSMRRPAPRPHLPGISPPWTRTPSGRLSDRGAITPDQLRAVLNTITPRTTTNPTGLCDTTDIAPAANSTRTS